MRTFVYVDGFNLYYAIRSKPGTKWLNLHALVADILKPAYKVECIKYFTARVSGAIDPNAPKHQQAYLNALETLPHLQVIYGNFLAKPKWRPLLNLPVANRRMANGATNHTLAVAEYHIDPEAGNARSKKETLLSGCYPKGGPRVKPPKPKHNAVLAHIHDVEEKGSDVNLAAHLLNDAWNDRFETAVVITNDTDLVTPIRMVAVEAAKPVILLSPPHGFDTPPALVDAATSVLHINHAHLRRAQFPDTVPRRNGKPNQRKPTGW